MSTATQHEEVGQVASTRNLRTQKVDVVASLLMSSFLIVGSLVFVLFVIWFTSTYQWQSGGIQVEPEPTAAGRGDHAEGFARDIEPPGAEEADFLNEPTLAESLEAVTDAVTSVAATMDNVDTDTNASAVGSGRGDSRPPGPLGEGEDIVSRFERWELKFLAKDVKTYASQLDFYKIELGCIGKSKFVDYAFGFSGAPQKRSGKGSDEKRLYFMWRQEGPLVAFDRQLLGQAGVQTQGRQMLKFIPKELEEKIYQIEMKYAISKGHSKVREIAKTVFESQPASSGYDFVVIEQRYRTVQ
jgi:hypothetical protein